ncbi:MAG: beta-lactamase family protein [Anaerolineae bacterium]|nr:beta-lactamase family protein [Anaerolineae bacterium]
MLVYPVQAATGTTSQPAPADLAAFFDAQLPEQLAQEHIAGATVAVVQGSELVFARGYGYADLEKQIPVQANETLFFIGSDGKLFTWTAVMQLAGQGKLDLHADVNQYLDFEIPGTFPEPITLHHLMTHTAGFEEDFNSLLLDDPRNLLPLRDHLLRNMPTRVYPPGTVSAYSNYGTALAGYIIERVSGQSYEAYLSENLLQPLGMTHSFVGNALPGQFVTDLSKGYSYNNGRYQPLDFEWTAAVPCAPVRTTVTDLSRFMIAHLNGGCVDGSCIMPTEWVDQIHSPQFSHHPQMSSMAYGFLDMRFNGQRVLWHMGESARFTTILALIPDQNLGLVVSYNTPPADGRMILQRFMDTFFPDTRPPLDAQPLVDWADRAKTFNGMYVPARSAHTTAQIAVRYTQAIEVEIEQGRLTFAGWDYRETEPGLFRQVDGDRVLAFKQDADGKRWLVAGPLAFFQVPWFETPILVFPLIGVSLFVFLTSWIAGLVITLRHKTHPIAERRAWWLAAGLSLFDVALLGWFFSVLLTLADRFVYHQRMVTIISVLSWLTIPWTLTVIGITVSAWRHEKWALSRRIHYTLVALSTAAFVWLLWSLNVLGGNL